jgi:hypothetical protein
MGRGWAMKDLITEIVKALVDQPEEVSVNEMERHGNDIYLRLLSDARLAYACADLRLYAE